MLDGIIFSDCCQHFHECLDLTAYLGHEIAAAGCSAKKHIQTAAAGTGECFGVDLTSQTNLKDNAGFKAVYTAITLTAPHLLLHCVRLVHWSYR